MKKLNQFDCQHSEGGKKIPKHTKSLLNSTKSKTAKFGGTPLFASNKKTVILYRNDEKQMKSPGWLTGWFNSHPDGTQTKACVCKKD